MSQFFGFGPAPSAAPPPPSKTDGSGPSVFVLSVLVSNGSFPRWMTIASSTERAALEDFVGKWLVRNANRYAGQFTIDPVPFILPRNK